MSSFKRLTFVFLLVLIVLMQVTVSVLAHEVTHYNRYSDLKVYNVTNDANQALALLRVYTWYKGKIWASAPTYDWRVRYRRIDFDHRSTGNWLGYGYPNNSTLVLECQRALAYLGYNPWDNQDGIWGPTTYNAVKRFQAANGLTVDGVVGRQTWYAMVWRK